MIKKTPVVVGSGKGVALGSPVNYRLYMIDREPEGYARGEVGGDYAGPVTSTALESPPNSISPLPPFGIT